MRAPATSKRSAIEEELEARNDRNASGARGRTTLNAKVPEQGTIAPLTKLISRIPPAPRVPYVEGMSHLAPTVTADSSTPASTQDSSEQAKSAPRWRVRQETRAADKLEAWGAVLAAVLLGAFIFWASS